jgi:hypothetical protein
MRAPLVFAFSALTLAGCQTNADAPDSPPLPPTEQAIAAPASLVGEYRVAGIDGTEVGGGIGIALSVTADEIAFDPRCAGFRWSYSYSGRALAVRRHNGPVCKIGVHPEQQRLATALDAVTQVRRTPSNAIELTGGGHSVTLFSQ